jgi:site-specific recombinase XerD
MSLPAVPDFRDKLISLVLDSLPSPASKQSYKQALSRFLEWFAVNRKGETLTRSAVLQYRASLLESGLSSATVNLHLAAVKKLAQEAADNGMLAANLAQGISRIKGIAKKGVRAGNWLTVGQAEDLLECPDASTLAGKRDRAILGVLLGCGLRRQEAARLSFAHIQQRDARWVIVDLVGKGQRVRTVPMPTWEKLLIDDWSSAGCLSEGIVFRGINRGDHLHSVSMTAQAIFDVVKKYSEHCGLQVAPHDLRRSFAKLAHKGKAALEQIQLSLGHASIQTTERYLGVRQDLTDAPCDHLGISMGPKAG